MKFHEAVEQAKGEKKIRRKDWAKDCWIIPERGVLKTQDGSRYRNFCLTTGLGYESLIADDWEVEREPREYEIHLGFDGSVIQVFQVAPDLSRLRVFEHPPVEKILVREVIE